MSKKEKTYLRLGLFFLSVGLVITLAFGTFRFGHRDERTEIAVEEAADQAVSDVDENDPIYQAFQEESINHLHINGGYGEIYISSADYFYVDSGYDLEEIYVEGDTLCINTGQDSFDEALYLSLPGGYQFQSAEISVGAGLVEIADGLIAGQISVTVGAGEFYGYGLTGEENCRLTTGAGTCNAYDLRTEHLEAETGIGTMDLSAAQLGTANISTGIGNTMLSLPGERSDYDYEISSEMGAVTLGEETFDFTDLPVTQDNGQDRTIHVENGVGSTEIYFGY